VGASVGLAPTVSTVIFQAPPTIWVSAVRMTSALLSSASMRANGAAAMLSVTSSPSTSLT
jgi:hypothetical protein